MDIPYSIEDCSKHLSFDIDNVPPLDKLPNTAIVSPNSAYALKILLPSILKS